MAVVPEVMRSEFEIGISPVSRAKMPRELLGGSTSETEVKLAALRSPRAHLPVLSVRQMIRRRDVEIIPKRFGNVFRFTVTSTGVTGQEWFSKFRSREDLVFGKFVGDLLSLEVLNQPRVGVTYSLEVVLGDRIVHDSDRDIRRVREHIVSRKRTSPPAEVACLTCDILAREDLAAMGVSRLVFMHKPIIHHGVEHLLDLNYTAGKMVIGVHCGGSHVRFSRSTGFVSLVSQSDTQSV